MKVAIIGTGKMGRGFAAALSPGHQVVFGSRDPDRAAKTVAATGAADAVPYGDAVARAGAVILTVPWRAMEEVLDQLGDLRGAVVADVSTPYGPDLEKLGRSSTGEWIQKRRPDARVVKAWNHVHASDLTKPEVGGIAASVLIAGDDAKAKEVVSGLARDMGFHPVDAGPLRECRSLDRLVNTMLFVRLGPIRVLSSP